MKHLFVLNNGISDHEVKDTDFKEYYPSVNRSMAWASMERYAKTAARTYIIPFVTKAIYDDLADNLDTVDPEKREILDILKSALAFYTIYDAMPHVNTVISDLGVTETHSDKSQPAQDWRFKNTRWECMLKGDLLIDQALQLINTTNAYVLDYGTVFFTSAEHISDYVNIQGFRAWQKMKPFIREGEEIVKSILCEDYDVLTNSVDPRINGLVERIRRYVVDYATVLSIPRLSLVLDGDRLKLLSSIDGFNLRSNALTSFGSTGPVGIINHLRIDIGRSKQRIKDYIAQNIDLFPNTKENLATYSNQYITSSADCVGGVVLM